VGAGDSVVESSTLATEIDSVQSSVTFVLGANVENLTLTGSAIINGTGNAGVNTLIGNSAANVLDGAAGNDAMLGGLGNDTYVFSTTTGIDTITDTDTTSGNADLISVGTGTAFDQVWLRHVGDNLEVSIIGTANTVTITNWYNPGLDTLNATAQIEKIKVVTTTTSTASDDELLAANVQALVVAMASVSSTVPATTTLSTTDRATLNTQLTASWT
jgi:Ca2+-binding RTX toxin-like protein